MQHLNSPRRNRVIFVVLIGLFSFAALRIAMALGLEPTAATQANVVTGAMFGATLALGGTYAMRAPLPFFGAVIVLGLVTGLVHRLLGIG
ncbi:hypothetical protein RG903_05805 [Thermithiobacillus tepidarius DSM 3134]|uniref:hypothetical protein n=1 Tax=Thermithiobacillus tepidarius TaxID=929 RepID=UPI000422E70F|nr:hypothetical protein [Thermithiobacillus tepidarius]